MVPDCVVGVGVLAWIFASVGNVVSFSNEVADGAGPSKAAICGVCGGEFATDKNLMKHARTACEDHPLYQPPGTSVQDAK